MSTYDRGFAFDYDGSGKPDDLTFYRPGSGTFWVLENQHKTPASFMLPYPPPPPEGIGGYDLMSTADQVFAFDYEGNGNLDDLVLFRAGPGTIWVLQNTHVAPPNPPTFTRAFQQTGEPPYTAGIAGFDLFGTVDQGTTIDFSGVGYMDYLLFFRPGTGTVAILENNRTNPGSFDTTPYQAGVNSVMQVQQNLTNIKALNEALYTSYVSPEIQNAYLLLTGNKDNSTSWGLTTALEILSGVFAAAAAAVGTITGVTAIIAGSAAFVATFAPGMISSWIESGSTPGGGSLNDTFAGLVETFQHATHKMNKKLGDYASDVEGHWTKEYSFNNKTQAISALANVTFPTGGPGYNLLQSQMQSQLLLAIWQTIMKADYKVVEFASIFYVPPPPASYYTEYYSQYPAYYIVAGDQNGTQFCTFFNIGTGPGQWYGFHGRDDDGSIAPEAATFLFSHFDRGTVFSSWGLPLDNWADNPPKPWPPS